jgi:hypothetical protein
MNTTTEPEADADERDPVQEMRERMLAAGFTPERAKAKREVQLQLQQQYPGMHALIREQWDGERLVEPYLLAVGATRTELYRLVEELSADAKQGAVITYIWPANKAMGF